MKSRIVAVVGLLVLLLVSGGYLLSLQWAERLSTNVMELIPDRSPSPELSLGRSVLNDVYANRVMVAMRAVEDPRSVGAYVATLQASPLVEQVVDLSDAQAFADVGQFVFQHRFELLLPEWLSRMRASGVADEALATTVVEHLDAALNDPGFVAFEAIVPSDPLLLMQQAAEAFQLAQPGRAVSSDTALLEVSLTVSALTKDGQAPVFTLLEQAEGAARQYSPHLRVLDTGAHRYAAETEAAMRQEVQLLNTSTLVVVFLICVFFCRRVFLVVHVFIILFLSLVSGVALLLLLFDQLHVFALVFGCVLCGVIVDYGLHAYLHDAGKAGRSLRTFLKPFLISCGSTLIGFSILLFSELPVLRQMGTLVVCGLFMAIIVTLVYIFGVLGAAPASQPVIARTRGASASRSATVRLSRTGLWLVGLIVVLVIGVLPMVQWEDDIRSLKYPLPHLDAVDAEIRNLHGGERTVILTVGEDYAASRMNVERLSEWLREQGATAQSSLSARAWVPTFEAYAASGEFVATHPDFAEQVQVALEAGGFDGASFAPFARDWAAVARADIGGAEDYEQLVGDFSSALSGGLSGILGANESLYWWVTLVDAELEFGAIPEDAYSLRLSQVESMSSVLARYRERTLELSLIAGLAMYLVLLGSFGWREGSLIVCVPVVSILGAVAFMYVFAGSLGIFHLIGLFLGACLVLDYAVFTWIGMKRDGAVPFSVIVSALTTVASFFILCWSQIPAIHSLGLSVFTVTLLGAICSYVWIPTFFLKRKDGDAH